MTQTPGHDLNLNYLTPREACTILRVCLNTLADMIQDGRVKAVDRRKPGGKYAKWLILADSLYNPTDPAERIAQGEIERGLGCPGGALMPPRPAGTQGASASTNLKNIHGCISCQSPAPSWIFLAAQAPQPLSPPSWAGTPSEWN